jgi:diguanylate cyclase
MEFLDQLRLEPMPENYQFAWDYLYGDANPLRRAVDDRLRSGHRITSDGAQELQSQFGERMTAERIDAIMGDGERALSHGNDALQQSARSNQRFGSTLQKQLEALENDPGEIQSRYLNLIRLTRSMAEKAAVSQRELRAASEQLGKLQRELESATERAETDQLTGLPNRWAFEKALEEAVEYCRSQLEPLALAFVDVDHFKAINDRHGHDTGDRVLRRIAEELNRLSDSNTHIARHGGEEFVLLFRGTTAAMAKQLLDEERMRLSAYEFLNRDTGQPINRVSFSAGIADLCCDGDARAMMRRADLALYAAKAAGRDRVIVSGE